MVSGEQIEQAQGLVEYALILIIVVVIVVVVLFVLGNSIGSMYSNVVVVL